MTTPCVSDLALPPDDGAICRAVEELRTKIAAWSHAVAEVESRLADRAAERHKEPIQPEADLNAAERQQAEFAAAAQMEAADTGEILPTAQPESEADVNARLETADPTIANTVRRKRQDEASDEPEIQIIEECEQQLHDHEDLLEALAPAVAEAIRVEHRLFNGRRCIRELIEAHRDDPVEPREKRPWWKRGKR